MLKFATHNDYLHFFSFPGDNGAGYQGWKEITNSTFMSLSPAFDEIILRGIKTGNRIRMMPLSGQYTPESYLETIRSSQLAITETEFKVMANGEQIGTLTRPNATLTTNFRQYAASKVWSFRYSYRQQAFDDYGRPKVDEHGKPVYETVEANDPVSVIYLPDGIMQFLCPYTFRGELFGLPNQTVQTFKWQLGPYLGIGLLRLHRLVSRHQIGSVILRNVYSVRMPSAGSGPFSFKTDETLLFLSDAPPADGLYQRPGIRPGSGVRTNPMQEFLHTRRIPY